MDDRINNNYTVRTKTELDLSQHKFAPQKYTVRCKLKSSVRGCVRAELARSKRFGGNTDLVEVTPVNWFKLLRFATLWEVLLLVIGTLFACGNGFMVPVGMIIYGEFTALLIDRTVMKGNSTPTLTLQWFGGGRLLSNASLEENRLALIEDSQAFGIGCMAFSVLQFVCGMLSVDLFNYTALNQINRIKVRFLRAVLRQDIAWYDLNTSLNFATKIADDLEKFREGINEKIPMLIYLVMSFVSGIIISMVYGWELTLMILACTPVIIATTALVAKVQSSLTTKELEAYSIAGIVAEEVLSAIRTVVAFGGEEKEIKRYGERLEPAKRTGTRKGMFAGLGSAVMWFIVYCTYALSFWYGVKLIMESRHLDNPVYTPATLIIVFSVLPLRGGAHFAVEATNAMRIGRDDLRSQSPDEANIRYVHALEQDNKQTFQVLNNLNIKICKHETVALVGPSGCGKSTVLQLLQRMYDPDAGSVTASGYDLRDMNVKHLRSHIAVVGQEPVLFAGTIRENIRMSNPACTDEEIAVAARQAYCHNFIEKLPN
ncbi:Multidrug resistance protein homolog 49, partial [Eumeta japonica]